VFDLLDLVIADVLEDLLLLVLHVREFEFLGFD